MRGRLAQLILLVMPCFATISQAQLPTVAELKAKWRNLENREMGGVGYTVAQDYSVSVANQPRRHFNWAVELGSINGRVLQGSDFVACWNEKYGFNLTTKPPTSDFILSAVTVVSAKDAKSTLSMFSKSNMNGYIIRPYTFLVEDSVGNFLESGKMQIDSVIQNAEMIRVVGTLKFVNIANVPVWYDFSADLYPGDCRFRKVDLSLKNDAGVTLGTMSFSYTYRETSQGPQIERIGYANDIVPDGVLMFTPPTPLTEPEESYRLTHYGFPEPEGVVWEKKWPVPLYVWLLGIAGVLAIIALLFTWLRARQSRRLTPVPPIPPQPPPASAT